MNRNFRLPSSSLNTLPSRPTLPQPFRCSSSSPPPIISAPLTPPFSAPAAAGCSRTESQLSTGLEGARALPAGSSRIPAVNVGLLRPGPPYPESPLIKQYSAEYWLLASLHTAATAAVRVVTDGGSRCRLRAREGNQARPAKSHLKVKSMSQVNTRHGNSVEHGYRISMEATRRCCC